MVKGDTSRARQLLLDDLENLRSIKGWRIEVVYDGAGRNSRKGPLGHTRQSISAADRAPTKDVSKHGVRQVYTGSGVEADSYIEARCSGAKNVTGGAFSGSFIVATDDAMIRLAGQNAGALCMGADRFVNELKAVKNTVAYRVEMAMAKVNGEAVRPEKLWGTKTFARSSKQTIMANSVAKGRGNNNQTKAETTGVMKPLSSNPLDNLHTTADGKTVYTGRFGRGALVIEDKRKKKPRNKNGG
jgi:predicted RNA-binding protein with PIN domain